MGIKLSFRAQGGSYGARKGLFELDLSTRATRFVSPAESLPAWSADGSMVVWSVADDALGAARSP